MASYDVPEIAHRAQWEVIFAGQTCETFFVFINRGVRNVSPTSDSDTDGDDHCFDHRRGRSRRSAVDADSNELAWAFCWWAGQICIWYIVAEHQLVANFEGGAGPFDFPADTSPSLTALTNSLTNGSLDTLVFEFGAPSFTRPESFFATSGLADPPHFDAVPFLNGIDWQGFEITRYFVWISRGLQWQASDAFNLRRVAGALVRRAARHRLRSGVGRTSAVNRPPRIASNERRRDEAALDTSGKCLTRANPLVCWRVVRFLTSHPSLPVR